MFLFFSRLEQFQMVLFEFMLFPFTNSNLFVILSILSFIFMFQFMHNSKMIPSSSQAFIENVFFFMINLVENQIKLKGLKLYGAFLFTLFILILKFNVMGLIRYTFTVTSHLAISLGMSLSMFFGVMFIGFSLHNESYLDLFLPLGVRLILQPMLIYIEIVGFFAKAVSLGVSLSANMMAGHTLLKLTTMLVWNVFLFQSFIKVLFMIRLFLLMILTGLEIVISLIQAYVFVLLTSSILPQ